MSEGHLRADVRQEAEAAAQLWGARRDTGASEEGIGSGHGGMDVFTLRREVGEAESEAWSQT